MCVCVCVCLNFKKRRLVNPNIYVGSYDILAFACAKVIENRTGKALEGTESSHGFGNQTKHKYVNIETSVFSRLPASPRFLTTPSRACPRFQSNGNVWLRDDSGSEKPKLFPSMSCTPPWGRAPDSAHTEA